MRRSVSRLVHDRSAAAEVRNALTHFLEIDEQVRASLTPLRLRSTRTPFTYTERHSD